MLLIPQVNFHASCSELGERTSELTTAGRSRPAGARAQKDNQSLWSPLLMFVHYRLMLVQFYPFLSIIVRMLSVSLARHRCFTFNSSMNG